MNKPRVTAFHWVPTIPFLREYRDRCESRPAFQRALAAQLAPFGRPATAA